MTPVTIGDAILYNADCMTILPTLGKVDAVITDPPYGLGKRMQGGTWGACEKHSEMREWDQSASQKIVEQLLLLAECVVIWGGNYYRLPPTRGWLTWFKPDAPPSMGHFEMAWTSLNANARQLSCSIASVNAERIGHPTQKPLAVMCWSIAQAGNPETILDPFMGSGTTGVAAIQMGRKFIGIEKEERYFDIACKRIEAAYAQGQLFERAPMVQTQESLL